MYSCLNYVSPNIVYFLGKTTLHSSNQASLLVSRLNISTGYISMFSLLLFCSVAITQLIVLPLCEFHLDPGSITQDSASDCEFLHKLRRIFCYTRLYLLDISFPLLFHRYILNISL